jgi:hypothetical protein
MKINKLIVVIASLALVFGISSCGGAKQAAHQGSKEIAIPLSGKEYKSDATYFRSVGLGQSPDMATAKKIATLNARTELASSIASTIKAVTEQYINQVTIADKQEAAAKFEETSRNVVNQNISNVTIKEEKAYQSKEGKYSYYVCVEMPKAELVEEISNAISKDEKTKLDFDKYLFQKTFDEEMAKFENNK